MNGICAMSETEWCSLSTFFCFKFILMEKCNFVPFVWTVTAWRTPILVMYLLDWKVSMNCCLLLVFICLLFSYCQMRSSFSFMNLGTSYCVYSCFSQIVARAQSQVGLISIFIRVGFSISSSGYGLCKIFYIQWIEVQRSQFQRKLDSTAGIISN